MRETEEGEVAMVGEGRPGWWIAGEVQIIGEYYPTGEY